MSGKYLRDDHPQDLEALGLARIDYLFGMEGERPCRSITRLAEKHGVPGVVIRRYSECWAAEAEANAKTLSEIYSRAHEPETIEEFNDDVNFIRKQMDALRKQIDTIPDHQVGMETWKFKMGEWQRLQRRWSELTGIEEARKVSGLIQRDVARAMVKKEMEAAAPDVTNGERKVLDKSRFDMDPVVSIPT